MKKEEAFEAMKNGAKIAHDTWKEGVYLHEICGSLFDDRGNCVIGEIHFTDGWHISDQPNQSNRTAFLLKEISLHLEDPKRVWNYSGLEFELEIAKGIQLLHGEIEILKDQV